jgi:hypothetical protein
MAEPDELSKSRIIDLLKNELNQHPEILISTKSGRPFTEAERAAFFQRLEDQRQAQSESINSLLNQTSSLLSSLQLQQPLPGINAGRFLANGGSTSLSPHSGQQTPSEDVMEHLTQFGKWIEDTFSDPGLLRDSAQALTDIGKVYSAGAPLNTAGNSILPVIIQIGAKILGLG